MAPPLLLDAHALIRAEDTARYPFAPLGPALEAHERTAGLSQAQLLAALDAGGVARAVLVQRGRLYGYDNRYVCDAAAAAPSRLQCIVQLDPADPMTGSHTRDLLGRPGVVGLRFMEPVKGADLSWLESPGAHEQWRVACELGSVLHVHFFGWNRAAGLAVLQRRLAQGPVPPALVLDGLAGSAVESGAPDFGLDAALRAVLESPRVHLKLTAMTLARLAKAQVAAPALLERLVGMIGAQRLLWGSDVLAPGQTHGQVIAQMLEASAALPAGARRGLLHDTAAALYPLRQT